MNRWATALLCLAAMAPRGGGVADAAPEFVDIAVNAGLTHSIPNGGNETKEYIIETTGSGVGLVDYDNDGLLDALVISGGDGADSRGMGPGGMCGGL